MLNERKYTIETEQETDGRWIAEVLEIPGVLAYGDTLEQAQANVEALTLRSLQNYLLKIKISPCL